MKYFWLKPAPCIGVGEQRDGVAEQPGAGGAGEVGEGPGAGREHRR